MYCSTCGMPVVQGLSYCNYCGGKLAGAKGDQPSKPTEVRPELLVFGMISVLVLGLVAITFLMMAMKMVGLNERHILGLTILSFLMMLMVEGTLICQFMRQRRSAEEPARSVRRATQELDDDQLRVLPEGVPSVTEHTT